MSVFIAPVPAPTAPRDLLTRSVATVFPRRWLCTCAQGARLCSYTGMLYCPGCHTNSSAIIPARVLHHWDFARRPVSALAAEFLASIASQPLLCIGAVNPGLYARIPALSRAHELRSRTVKALAVARANGSAQKVLPNRLIKCPGLYTLARTISQT